MSEFDQIVRDILERVSLVQVISETVQLKKQGRRFVGLCPFHSEKTPSFSVSDEMKLYYCFGCQAGGNAITYLTQIHGLSRMEALERLAGIAGVVLPERRAPDPAETATALHRSDLLHANQTAHEYFQKALVGPEGAEALAYLEERGIGLDSAKKFGLGFGGANNALTSFLKTRSIPVRDAEEVGLIRPSQHGSGHYESFRERLVFPIFNLDGAPIAFSGRLIPPKDEGPKYTNSPESIVYTKGQAVFGLYTARQAIRTNHSAILVEGNFDVVSLSAAGVENVVAPLGTALTAQQLKLLRRFADTVTVFFDGDEAGRKASRRAVSMLIDVGVEGRIAMPDRGQDPDSIVRDGGASAIQTIVLRARPMITFLIESLVAQHGRTPHGLRLVVEEASQVFSAEKDRFRYGMYREELARVLGVDVREIRHLTRDPVVESKARTVSSCPSAERIFLELLTIRPALMDRYLEKADPNLFTDPEARAVLQDIMNATINGEEPATYLTERVGDGGALRSVIVGSAHNPEQYPDPELEFDRALMRLEIARLEREEKALQTEEKVHWQDGLTESASALAMQRRDVMVQIQAMKKAVSAVGSIADRHM